MTPKQEQLMQTLTKTLQALSLECEQDQNFNSLIGQQDIFSRSMDEILASMPEFLFYYNSENNSTQLD